MLTLRRGVVVDAGPDDTPMQRLEVEVDGARRSALSDVALMGSSAVGDDVVVNVAGLDLRLGSGGFDLLHCNLTRGLHGDGVPGAHVMKLNYTSLQHAVHPVESERRPAREARPVAICLLHGQLAPFAWAVGEAVPGARVGYVQTPGGALPGALSDAVGELRSRGLLATHITAGPCYGGDGEAITVAGALEHGLFQLGWDAAVCAPGPGIVGSATALGHGGLAAVDSVHAALALEADVVIVPRLSSADPRPRHHGISHHTLTVMDMLLGEATVAMPASGDADALTPGFQQRCETGAADLDGYAASGLPSTTMGRTLDEDPLFFAAALAGGSVLGRRLGAA